MAKSVITRGTKVISIAYLTFCIMIAMAAPAYATDVNATEEVTPMKTEHKWFYWLGWIFIILTVLVLAAVLFFWVRNILLPKYRGRKVAA